MKSNSQTDLLAQGNACYKQGDVHGAAEFFRKATGEDPGSFAAQANLGNVLFQMCRYEEAIHAYMRALEIRDSAIMVARNLGACFDRTNRLKLAGKYYRIALEIKPGSPEILVDLGNTSQKLGMADEAMQCYERALAIDPTLANAMHNIGLCLYDDRDLSKAQGMFRRAVEMDPGNSLGACFLGVVLEHQGRKTEAGKYLREATANSEFNRSLVESSRYAFDRGAAARYFSNTADVLRHAMTESGDDGLVMEFGVYYGSSINVIAQQTKRMVHGFDSFEGLPESWYVGSEKVPTATEPSGAYTTKGILPSVPDNVALHPGRFDEALPDFVNKYSGNASFINIDCDIYSSTKTILEALAERITRSTVIVFDEYFCYPEWRDHEYKAFQEMVRASACNYEYIAFSYFTGQAVVRIT